MPIRYIVDGVHHTLMTHADGVVTFHEINEHLDMEERNRDFDVPELIDARGATTDLTADQVRRLVDRATSMLRVVHLGATAIVSTNLVVFGMARMYAILAERSGISVEVFRDVETATRWLDQFSRNDS